MTNPQGPPPNDPSGWGRPGNQGPFGNPQAPTERLRTGQPYGGPPQQPHTVPGQASDQTEQIGATRAGGPPAGYPPPTMPPAPPTERLAGAAEEPGQPKKKGRLRTPLAIFLVLILVLGVLVVGAIVAELIVRDKATKKIASAAACEAQDSATAEFGVAPLVLWQLATDHYTNITVDTAGNKLRTAQGMKLHLNIKDIQLKDGPDSKGTIGSIDATITWTADGIKDTVKNAISGLGGFLFSSVKTSANDGTVNLKGTLDNLVIKPEASNGALKLEVVSLEAIGFKIGKDKAQTHLDSFTSDLMQKLPLGIKVDNVQVTDSAVVAHLVSQNATIPANKTQDDCFKNL